MVGIPHKLTKLKVLCLQNLRNARTHARTHAEEKWASARTPRRWEGWISSSLLHWYQFAYVIIIHLIWPALQILNDGWCFLWFVPAKEPLAQQILYILKCCSLPGGKMLLILTDTTNKSEDFIYCNNRHPSPACRVYDRFNVCAVSGIGWR